MNCMSKKKTKIVIGEQMESGIVCLARDVALVWAQGKFV